MRSKARVAPRPAAPEMPSTGGGAGAGDKEAPDGGAVAAQGDGGPQRPELVEAHVQVQCPAR